tara:strand:+ start:1367 stop:1939 length:573 start_codon:yes stop_codon:yes gene_type:complete
MLDLFSGLKGASQAFINSDEWEVITVDNNPELEPDICCDIENLWLHPEFQTWKKGEFDLIWASPPCVEFFKVLAPFYPDDYGRDPSMELVETAKAIIDILQPTYWVIENTKSGSEFIKKILGNYRMILGPFYLWGVFPKFDAHVDRDHKSKVDVWSTHPLRSNIKAKVPIEISRSLLDSIDNQKILNLDF